MVPTPSMPDSIADANRAAVRAMSAGDFHGAQAILRRALLVATDNTNLWLNLAASCRALGDDDGALEALEGALRVSPRAFRALLMKGSLLEKRGERRQAAMLYGAAVALVPRRDVLDDATRSALDHGQRMHMAYVDELAAYIHREMGPIETRGDSVSARRVARFVELTLGRKQNYRQEPTEFFYPGLPAIEFWEREEFPWIGEFERAAPRMRAELLEILRDDFRDFVPYVDYPDGLPLDQWKALNQSRRWGALHLLKAGERVEENCRRCPQTLAALEPLPLPRVPRRSPAAMFSALQPGTRIPPHTGVANTRLVVHLPLIVPEGCGFRVGNETRHWREGQAWVFDDTIEHEAWNDSAEPRVIFICDVWNPRLSEFECQLIAEMMMAMDKFNGFVPETGL
ncbi:MAG TPA: aspartyl/asparaginyl beta-hydroxylase domain-containing protein [Solimonas sp.]|nr:aspartyl/asparaginyl beta-hydroxylase domain-containing protein [Solimonas sp.]